MELHPQVAGPLVVIFCIAILPATLVVPLLCYQYLPMLFGPAVSAAERVVHYLLIKSKNEAYRSRFEVGNMFFCKVASCLGVSRERLVQVGWKDTERTG